MQFQIVSDRTGRVRQVDFRKARTQLAFAGGAVLLAAIVLLLGVVLGRFVLSSAALNPDAERTLERQQRQIDAARGQLDGKVDALAERVGTLNAQLIRLDALGRRLTELAGLDRGEFDFDKPPPSGGPADATESAGGSAQVPELAADLNALQAQVDDRERQLSVLESLLATRQLGQRLLPGGLPLIGGWISSHFGHRTDPFTGRGAFHSGVDFAGTPGSKVVAVGPGVVSFSGYKSGYGNVVEITHPTGYVTRYGHNSRNLVKVGQSVARNQSIAVIGSTGRSTGTHVHFEVEHDGRVLNPMRYLSGP
jgi:murein DD-endopeptidase MepM/ murein hydrolase activator NlpD